MSEPRKGLSDHPVVIIVALLAGIIAIIVFVTGRDSLPAFFESGAIDQVTAVPEPRDEPTVVQSDVSEEQPVTIDCSQLIESEHVDPQVGAFWELEPINEDRNVHIWSNHWPENLDVRKFFLPAGESASFESGGGVYWTDRPGCTGPTRVAFEKDDLPEVSYQEYLRYINDGTQPQ